MTTERLEEQAAPVGSPGNPTLRRILTVRNFAVFSVVHSVLFTGLMVCAFVLGKPQPATFFFGFTHGVLYMVMAVACVSAARLRIVSVTMALVVVIVGLFGPYFGAYEFLREERRLLNERSLPDAG
jgi:hypothetical protein